jgi:hypothetical protein
VSLFDNKIIAMVSNAPSLIGSGFGPEIDAADLVIRSNRFTTEGYEADVGSRTDVYACHFLACKSKEELDKIQPGHCFLCHGTNEILIVPEAMHYRTPTVVTNGDISPNFVPTLGLIMIQYILRWSKMERLRLYGFADKVNGHYFDKQHKMCDFHDMATEAQIIDNFEYNSFFITVRRRL